MKLANNAALRPAMRHAINFLQSKTVTWTFSALHPNQAAAAF